MKKLILIIVLGLFGLCFADTARLQKMVEVFLEKGSYIKVVGETVKYYPKRDVTNVEINTGKEDSSDYISFTYLSNSYDSGLKLSFEVLLDDITSQDANGNITAVYK